MAQSRFYDALWSDSLWSFFLPLLSLGAFYEASHLICFDFIFKVVVFISHQEKTDRGSLKARTG